MEEFKRYIKTAGGVQQAATRLGRQRQALYVVLMGYRPMSLKLAKAIEADSLGRFKARKLLEL